MIKAFPDTLKFNIVDMPEIGIVTGKVIILQSSGKKIQHLLTREEVYRAHVKITDSNNDIFYQGNIFFQTKSFNPIFKEINIKADVVFKKKTQETLKKEKPEIEESKDSDKITITYDYFLEQIFEIMSMNLQEHRNIKQEIHTTEKISENLRTHNIKKMKEPVPSKENPPKSIFDGPTKRKKIAVYSRYEYDFFNNKVKIWLQKLGYQLSENKTISHFIDTVQNPDLILIISSPSMNSDEENLFMNSDEVNLFVQKLYGLYQQGVPLFIWANNESIYAEANLLLKKILGPNFELVSSYPGVKNSDTADKIAGKFDMNHPVAKGLSSLQEGLDVCHPNITDNRIKVFAFNSKSSHSQAMSFYKLPQGQEGILWVDTGFLKLDSVGNAEENVKNYISNIVSFCIDS